MEQMNNLIASLCEDIKTRNALLDRLECLLERSEARIEQTNTMVCKLTEVIGHLTDEYSIHLSDLSNCRNALVEQNTQLIKEVDRLLARLTENEQERQKSDNEWRTFLRELAMSRSSSNNINVQ